MLMNYKCFEMRSGVWTCRALRPRGSSPMLHLHPTYIHVEKLTVSKVDNAGVVPQILQLCSKIRPLSTKLVRQKKTETEIAYQ